MIPNNNLSILPFYDTIDKQNHRKDYAFGEIFPLFTPDRKILPFQIIRTTRANTINIVNLKKVDGTIFLDITTPMLDTGLTIIRYESLGYDIIQYNGVLPMGIDMPEGQYYISIGDSVEAYHSEVFTVVRDTSQYLKIEYWDAENLQFNNGLINFENSFKFNVYLPTQLGRPDYEFEEQVENRDGYQFIEKQVSEKTYKFNFLAPEFLCDAMRIIRMMDYITITDKHGAEYTVDQFLITPKWQDGGYIAAVEAEFQCDTVIKKIARGITPSNIGDYNDDFNDDYLNS